MSAWGESPPAGGFEGVPGPAQDEVGGDVAPAPALDVDAFPGGDAHLLEGVAEYFEHAPGGSQTIVGAAIQPAVFDHEVAARVLRPDGVALGPRTDRRAQ